MEKFLKETQQLAKSWENRIAATHRIECKIAALTQDLAPRIAAGDVPAMLTMEAIKKLQKEVAEQDYSNLSLEEVEKKVDGIYGDQSKNKTYYFSRTASRFKGKTFKSDKDAISYLRSVLNAPVFYGFEDYDLENPPEARTALMDVLLALLDPRNVGWVPKEWKRTLKSSVRHLQTKHRSTEEIAYHVLTNLGYLLEEMMMLRDQEMMGWESYDAQRFANVLDARFNDYEGFLAWFDQLWKNQRFLEKADQNHWKVVLKKMIESVLKNPFARSIMRRKFEGILNQMKNQKLDEYAMADIIDNLDSIHRLVKEYAAEDRARRSRRASAEVPGFSDEYYEASTWEAEGSWSGKHIKDIRLDEPALEVGDQSKNDAWYFERKRRSFADFGKKN